MTMALINLVEIYISEPRIYLSIDNEGITFVPLDGLIFVFSEDSIYVPNRETPTIRWEHITDISTMKEWYYTSVGGFKRWRVLIHVDNLYETGENPNQKTLCKQHYIDCDSIDISRKKLIHILNERLDKYRNSK